MGIQQGAPEWEYALIYRPGPVVSQLRWAARSAAGVIHTWDLWETAGLLLPATEYNICSEIHIASLELLERRGVVEA